jgi:hypothetical protein
LVGAYAAEAMAEAIVSSVIATKEERWMTNDQ